jgi:hypothetical protein
MCATCSAHLILLDFIIPIIFVEGYTFCVVHKLRGFSPLANYTDRAIAAGQRS